MKVDASGSLAVHWGWSFSSLGLDYSPQATPGFSTVRGYLSSAEPGVHPRGSQEARSVPPLSRVWPLFPIRLGAQDFAPPQPLFLPRQFSFHPSAGHAPTRPSLWTLTSYIGKGGYNLEAGKAGWGGRRVECRRRRPVEIFAEYFHGPMDCWGQTHRGRVPVNQAYLNPGSRH